MSNDAGPDCKDCGAPLEQIQERAMGNGEVATVWADQEGGGWVCEETGNEHRPGKFQLSAVEAMDLAIFGINTWMHPDASTPRDIERLERLNEHAVTVLCEIREWVIAQGEDFEERLDQDREWSKTDLPLTEAGAVTCEHGNKVWFGHECGLCENVVVPLDLNATATTKETSHGTD